MTSRGSNHGRRGGRGRGRGRSVWVTLGSAVDHGFRPSERLSSNVKDDGVQDSNCRVPNNQLDEASSSAGIADAYSRHRRSQHGQTSPKREANSSSKCTWSTIVVGPSYQQVESAGGYYHHRGSQNWQTLPKREANRSSNCTQHGQTLPKREANSSSKCTWSPIVVGPSYQQVESSGGYYHHRGSQHGQTSPKREANSSSKCTWSPIVVGPSYQQVESAGGYYHHRGSQHWQTLPKREANRSSNCTQSETVGSSWQQDEHTLPACSVGKDNSPNNESTWQHCTTPNRAEDSSSSSVNAKDCTLPNREEDNSSSSVNDKDCNVHSGSRLRSSQNSQLSQHQSNSPNLASDNLLDRLSSSKDIPSTAGKTHHQMISPEKEADDRRTEHFDICQKNKTWSPFALKPCLLVQNREKKKELESMMRSEILRPGMVLLKKYISHTDQIKIVKKCRELGLGPGGLYQPGYRDGAKLLLQMMCLGKNWDPELRSYADRRPIDDACPPSIPVELKQLVEKAIQDSHTLIKQELKLCNVEGILPGMSPDVCIVNFYTESGRLGLHQDQDESPKSLKSGLPVVSFSIGNSAEFLYGDDRDPEKAEKVILESGDMLIFGGSSRHVYHGVTSIKPNTAPSFLVEEANLRPGRINLTFRKS